jgi:hypothetical protein
MGETPKWIKRRVRLRMQETGEKYTKTLRDIKAELEAQTKRENTRVYRHEAETDPRGHDADGACCHRAKIAPLPEES